MATINISLRGVEELNQYFLRLPKNLTKELMSGLGEFASEVQKSAKLRAPRLTGGMASTIKLTPEYGNHRISIYVDDPAAVFQEMGFRPHMVYPYMTDRRGHTLLELGFETPVMVRKNTPFLQPALEKSLARLNSILNEKTDEAIRK